MLDPFEQLNIPESHTVITVIIPQLHHFNISKMQW